MRRADLCCREQARRRRVAQSPQLSQDGLEPEGDVPCDVFEEDAFRAAFADDAGDVGPEMAGIPENLIGNRRARLRALLLLYWFT